MQLFDLSGRRALITGSSMGIGFALARGLAQAGADMVLNARNSARLEEAAGAWRAEGTQVADPEFSAWLDKRTPAGRWGKVEELVGACVFPSSEAASFVNGIRYLLMAASQRAFEGD